MVGAVRTKTLLMLVPSRMREVRVAHAASSANWSPPWPSAIQAELVAEALSQDDEIDDFGRVGAARNSDADPAHPVPPSSWNAGRHIGIKPIAQ